MTVLVLNRRDVEVLLDADLAREAVRAALIQVAEGGATTPTPFEMLLEAEDGEIHVKGGHLKGSPIFALKTATGFAGNTARGLPPSSGMTSVYSAATGQLKALVLDGGVLTDLRTAAAGALAAELLSNTDSRTVGIIGTGGQAWYQLEALTRVRAIERVLLYGRRPEAVNHMLEQMRSRLPDLQIAGADSIEAAVSGADIVVTATSSTSPIVMSSWIRPGTHITAMGSDMPHKQELESTLLVRATKYVPDNAEQALTSGELHQAVATGIVGSVDDVVYADLPALVAGRLPGRSFKDEITIADLTGLGIEDVAMAELVTRRASELGMGTGVDLGLSAS